MPKQMNQLNSEDRDSVSGIPPFVLGAVDFCLLNGAFFSLNYWKRGTLDLSPIYVKLLFAFYGIWIIVSLSTKKFRLREYQGLGRGIWTLGRSGLYLAYCVAIMVVLLGLYGYSRGQVFGTCLILVGLECLLFFAVYLLFLKPGTGDLKGQPILAMRPSRVSWRLFVVDFVLVGVSFFIVNYFKRDSLHLLPDYEKLLLLIYGLWFIFSLATRKFERLDYAGFYHALWPWIKAVILMIFALGLIVFISRFLYFSRTQVFGPFVLLLVFEILFYRLYFVYRKAGQENADIESARDVRAILKQERLPLETDLEAIKQSYMAPVSKGLRDRYLANKPALYDFIGKWVELDEIIRLETVIRNSSDMLYSDRAAAGRYIRLFINLRKINDVRWINRYFLDVHQLLVSNGYFVGQAHTIATYRNWMLRKYPRQIANGLYAVDFLFNRVFPKLPWIRQVYFSFTKGKNRIISRAELLGRLCFCGFEIVAEQEIDERLCFVARKIKTPSLDQSPSYGPLVEFKRIGTNNEVIHTYKFRTMHPYSEFLQDYVYEKSGLRKGGKMGGDFRVTEWGKVMRKLWVDELPMLYNWVRGDLKLFGVRPLSAHYLSLYPQDLKELRKAVKPGLVPPFYADMPKTFDEICESERRYIEAYLKRPVRTQVVYFWKAFYNIVFKGARSH